MLREWKAQKTSENENWSNHPDGSNLFIYLLNEFSMHCTALSRLGRETNVQLRDDAYRVTTQQFELNVKKIIENKSFACLSSARLHNLNFMLELLQCNKGQSWDFFICLNLNSQVQMLTNSRDWFDGTWRESSHFLKEMRLKLSSDDPWN